MARCNGFDCFRGCERHLRYWENVARRAEAEGFQAVLDDLREARDAFQEVWDNGWPVRREDLDDAWKIRDQVYEILGKMSVK